MEKEENEKTEVSGGGRVDGGRKESGGEKGKLEGEEGEETKS